MKNDSKISQASLQQIPLVAYDSMFDLAIFAAPYKIYDQLPFFWVVIKSWYQATLSQD